MAGVLLITVPAKTENINTVNATTEEIDGHEYAVLNLYQDTDETTVNDFLENNDYVKLVVQEDIVYSEGGIKADTEILWRSVSADADSRWVIFDLNGYTISLCGTVGQLGLRGEHIEVWDSSAGGTGKITGGRFRPYTGASSAYVAVYGGTFDTFAPACNTNGPLVQCDVFGGVIHYLERNNSSSNIAIKIDGGYVGKIDGKITKITSVFDGMEYETVYLTDDDANNRSLIGARTTGNYRYVLTADWQLGANVSIKGDAVILDLNGYTLAVNPNGNNSAFFSVYAATFTVTDTSAAAAGQVVGNGEPSFTAREAGAKKMIIAGGTITQRIQTQTGVKDYQIIFRGGNYTGGGVSNFNGSTYSVVILPYYREQTMKSGIITYDSYAVSTSPTVLGLYNYEFNVAADLHGAALGRFSVPADKTYYLWARNADGAYEYLNIVYRDGEWQKVA